MRQSASRALVRQYDYSADASDEARIGALVQAQPDGCWLYRGKLDEYGRAWLPHQKRQVTVHRWVYEILVGPIPSGYHLHHECETPGCCNPEHLTPLHPKQHRAEHGLLEMDVDPRDPMSVLKMAKAMRRRRGAP